MSELVLFTKRDGIGVITIDNPPVNALSPGVPEGILSSLELAKNDPSVRALIVIGAGRTFVAGADIKEFAKIRARGLSVNRLPALKMIEDCTKPVVMAIHGTALGGGLELAMAGHYRVVVPDAQVGQPEVKIGLIPGAGGTQRLPRLAGVMKTAVMCALGEPISARNALETGIVDQIIEGDLLAGAIAFAGSVTATRKTRDLPVVPADISEVRTKLRPNPSAPHAALDAIDAAMALPFEDGIRRESEIF